MVFDFGCRSTISRFSRQNRLQKIARKNATSHRQVRHGNFRIVRHNVLTITTPCIPIQTTHQFSHNNRHRDRIKVSSTLQRPVGCLRKKKKESQPLPHNYIPSSALRKTLPTVEKGLHFAVCLQVTAAFLALNKRNYQSNSPDERAASHTQPYKPHQRATAHNALL